MSGIARFGLFVKLDETGADGIIPLAHLGREYWRYIERDGTLKGEDSGQLVFGFGNGATATWDANRYNESEASNPRYTFGAVEQLWTPAPRR